VITTSIPNEYNQHEEESYEDWSFRLLLGKAKKEVKLSWAQIRDMLGLTCTTDHLRHQAHGMLAYASYQREAHTDATAIGEIEAKEAALRREKMRMQDQKRELNKLLREWARAEHLEETIQKAVKGMHALPVIPSAPFSVSADAEKKEAALLLSDWHYGQWSSNSCNTFNDKVFNDRIIELMNQVILYCAQHNVSTVHVFALGDLINGLIHVTTRISNTENVIDQTIHVAESLAYMLNVLSAHCEVKVYFARGNHDRVTPNKKESITGESFFDLIPWYLQARLQDNNKVEFAGNTIDSEIISADIMGSLVYGVHGHRDKVPTVVQNLSLMTKRIPDYVVMGHTHHAESNEIQGAEVIVNPSLSGTDSYAYELRRTSKPAQTLLIFTHQGLLCTYKINLS
jgi:UDP-2,3-diacylglucosamine pyrophosphatase LpxH